MLIASMKLRNPTRCCGSKKSGPAAMASNQVQSTTQPCHIVGGPQPQPKRYAGNQYGSLPLMMA